MLGTGIWYHFACLYESTMQSIKHWDTDSCTLFFIENRLHLDKNKHLIRLKRSCISNVDAFVRLNASYGASSSVIFIFLVVSMIAASSQQSLTDSGRATPICVGELTIIGSDNGLSPDGRQAII